ncbi:MAG: dockerin type I repeat-containing protein, partial [Ruminococcus sp.]|nr:dockerin type I repeat-containing protein [Ruminococcus sp.]
MKKLLNTLLCLSVMTGIVPTIAGAVEEPIYINDGAENWSKTVISGDVNDDGKLSIADAVILQQCLMNSYSPDDDFELDESKLDINFDGVFDIFDMVQ